MLNIFRRELWTADGKLKSWKVLNGYLRPEHSQILDVMDLLLTLYPSSAEAERGFTQLKLIKTDRRNSLRGLSVNNLLGVRLLTANVGDYNPQGKVFL